jgi:hypothetical protein
MLAVFLLFYPFLIIVLSFHLVNVDLIGHIRNIIDMGVKFIFVSLKLNLFLFLPNEI